MTGETYFAETLLFVIIWIVLAVLIFEVGRTAARSTKSNRYRKYLTNMYVSAKLRDISSNEGLNLAEEEKEFLKYNSLKDCDRILDLDDKIELEISKQIGKKED